MLTMDQREITGPGTGTRPADGRSSFRRILVPVRSPGGSGQALAVAARLCAMTDGVLRLVHVRTCDPPLRRAARFYRETTAQAAAILEEALLTAWPTAARPVATACRRPPGPMGPGLPGEVLAGQMRTPVGPAPARHNGKICTQTTGRSVQPMKANNRRSARFAKPVAPAAYSPSVTAAVPA
jgi:hypothetical protein